MKTTLTILLTLTMVSVMGQTKPTQWQILDSPKVMHFDTSMSISVSSAYLTMTRIVNIASVIKIDHADKNGNYTIHFNHKQLHWLNDSAAIYITTPSKKRYVKGFNHSRIK